LNGPFMLTDSMKGPFKRWSSAPTVVNPVDRTANLIYPS
jgi:hypothetical protein